MNPFQKKYNYLSGTHCWYCDREFGVDRTRLYSIRSVLIRTKDHIIPRSHMVRQTSRNLIACCQDCNSLKGPKNAKKFALKIEAMMIKYETPSHTMIKLFPLIRERAWKLYNKTSRLHKNYKKEQFISDV